MIAYKDVVYVVKTPKGWLSIADSSGEYRYETSADDAAIFSKDGALFVAKKNSGQAWSYNTGTGFLRRVNN